jgi:hypothetical protein
MYQYLNTRSQLSYCFKDIHDIYTVDWIWALVGWLSIVLRPARESFNHEDVTIAGVGLQNLGLCLAIKAFEKEGIFKLCTTSAVTQGY